MATIFCTSPRQGRNLDFPTSFLIMLKNYKSSANYLIYGRNSSMF